MSISLQSQVTSICMSPEKRMPSNLLRSSLITRPKSSKFDEKIISIEHAGFSSMSQRKTI
jgi:hypothetical protein